MNSKTESIVLGGGCFWCLDATYKLVKGIEKVEEGYSCGNIPNPTDEQIYSENTGHAEVVRLTFDPKVISLATILDIFFAIHDPTTVDRQGPDVGHQYRSVVFFDSDEQKQVIEAAIKRAQKLWDDKIVTEVVSFEHFYPASEYHKDYEINRPDYCQLIINPKLAKLRSKFSTLLK
ncbi:MAG TPA: peptide-methionine (S)-S-oxide reductase MsrA [Candidatus Saccharimonadales bacterium]